jgi:hypothetical protein
LIIPHLLLAHLLADYSLQTDWLAARKGQAWDGVLLHGCMVLVMTLAVLAPYFDQVVLPVLILFGVHTTQDALKVWLNRHVKLHLAWGYFGDQALHGLAILIFYGLVKVEPAPTHLDVLVMALAAALIAVTRFYDVSWWANWFEMIIYMSEWRVWGAVERVGMLLLAMGGLIPALLAPLVALPRLIWAWRQGRPLWRQKYGIIEWSLGIAFSIGLGYFGLFQLLQYYR